MAACAGAANTVFDVANGQMWATGAVTGRVVVVDVDDSGVLGAVLDAVPTACDLSSRLTTATTPMMAAIATTAPTITHARRVIASVSHPRRTTVGMLLPKTCPLCGQRGAAPCDECAAELEPAARPPPPPDVDHCVAVLAYNGPAREVVARLKYRNARSSIAWLADRMAASVAGLSC